jgi:hypothetical protein
MLVLYCIYLFAYVTADHDIHARLSLLAYFVLYHTGNLLREHFLRTAGRSACIYIICANILHGGILGSCIMHIGGLAFLKEKGAAIAWQLVCMGGDQKATAAKKVRSQEGFLYNQLHHSCASKQWKAIKHH